MNFKIITVNGVDLSNAIHEEASQVFEQAQEPITVVLRRTKGQRVPPATEVPVTNENASINPKHSPAPHHRCFCQHLLETCRRSPGHFSAYVYNQLQLFQMQNHSVAGNFQSPSNYKQSETSSCDTLDEDVFEPLYEDVKLERPSCKDKLGLALLDHKDPVTGLVRVIVNKITRHSIAEKCQRLRPGDQIVKINGIVIRNTSEASQLLSKNDPSVTFSISHHLSRQWGQTETTTSGSQPHHSDEVLRDVTNCVRQSDHHQAVSSPLDRESNTTITAPPVPTKNSSFHTNSEERLSATTEMFDSSSSCHVPQQQHQFQTPHNVCPLTNQQLQNSEGLKDVGKRGGVHSLAEEFTFVRPPIESHQEETNNKGSDQHSTDSCDSAKGSSMDRSSISEPHTNENALFKLTETLEHLELDALGTNTDFVISDDEDVGSPFQNDPSMLSPWVRIAQQDYEMLMMKQGSEPRTQSPHMKDSRSGSPNSSSFNGDNTSSAYSTGESFRSSSTSSGPRSTAFVDTANTANFDHDRALLKQDNLVDFYEARGLESCGGTTMNLVSSDCNSDGEEPACYLTHVTDTDSEGFEDASIEFRTVFNRSANNFSQPIPLPRKIHPPSNNKLSPMNASTADLCAAAADFARIRRTQLTSDSTDCCGNELACSLPVKCNNENRDVSSGSTATVVTDFPDDGGHSVLFDDRVKSNQANLISHHQNNSRVSFEPACLTQESDTALPGELSHSDVTQSVERNQNVAHDCSKEWKVRVRKDGTRYITKKTTSSRDKRLKQRERKLLTERCGATTDDDALTELKLGRHWSRDDRKRHMRIAKEKKRRREFMQRCRLEVLNENTPAQGEIIELSHQKQARRRNKRMLVDDFVTVQEILAVGDRDVGSKNPLLSVTYI